MTKKISRMGSAAILLLAGGFTTPGQAGAAFTVDQQNTTNTTFTVTVLPGLGQTFTPTLNSIDFATFIVSDTVVSTFQVLLYGGIGYGGPLLGSSQVQAVAVAPTPINGQPITQDGAQPAEFDFAAPIALLANNAYTLRLVQVTGSGGFFFARSATNNPYPGGTAYADAPIPTVDLVFSEGIRTAAVPEPGSLILCGVAGLIGLGYRGARRGRASA